MVGITGERDVVISGPKKQNGVRALLVSPLSTTGLKYSVTYDDGEIRSVTSDECSGRLEIDVEISLKTEDGSFDESWTATLIDDGILRYITMDLEVNDLAGSLQIAGFSPDDYTLDRYSFEIEWDESGKSTGGLVAYVSSSSGGAMVHGAHLDIVKWNESSME